LPLHPSPTLWERGGGEGKLAPATEVEQHGQQVSVVHNAVAIHIGGRAFGRAEREQYLQQVGVVHTAVAVHIALYRHIEARAIDAHGIDARGVIAQRLAVADVEAADPARRASDQWS